VWLLVTQQFISASEMDITAEPTGLKQRKAVCEGENGSDGKTDERIDGKSDEFQPSDIENGIGSNNVTLLDKSDREMNKGDKNAGQENWQCNGKSSDKDNGGKLSHHTHCYVPKRLIVTALLGIGLMLVYAMRTNLGVTVVMILDEKAYEKVGSTNAIVKV